MSWQCPIKASFRARWDPPEMDGRRTYHDRILSNSFHCPAGNLVNCQMWMKLCGLGSPIFTISVINGSAYGILLYSLLPPVATLEPCILQRVWQPRNPFITPCYQIFTRKAFIWQMRMRNWIPTTRWRQFLFPVKLHILYCSNGLPVLTWPCLFRDLDGKKFYIKVPNDLK